MGNPSVCAVMLTADRPELARRAVECFKAQTYPAKMLCITDIGQDKLPWIDGMGSLGVPWPAAGDLSTVGALRNHANDSLPTFPDILIHWDDDDYSHPNRIAEQVALLQSSGADAVGYREMLFWDERRCVHINEPTIEADHWHTQPGQAWLYSNPNPSYLLGTSLCYWRKTWERKPFEATSQGEDFHFCAGLKCASMSSLPMSPAVHRMPQMIARIHAGNTSNGYQPAIMQRAKEWKRVPEWDQYCSQKMEGK